VQPFSLFLVSDSQGAADALTRWKAQEVQGGAAVEAFVMLMHLFLRGCLLMLHVSPEQRLRAHMHFCCGRAQLAAMTAHCCCCCCGQLLLLLQQ
jgi:hypothetical protein